MPTTTKKAKPKEGSHRGSAQSSANRLNVQKTYKLFIGGKFPRTESGRYYTLKSAEGEQLGNICRASRKDFRESVLAARAAFKGWSAKSAFNRSQILYRLAEMLEGRQAQFIDELTMQGSTKVAAQKEVIAAVDRLVYYAGWCDKYQQIFSAVNPVASSHFNFSVLEPTGVVVIVAPEENSLIGLVTTAASAIAGGNTSIILASESKPLCAVSFAEVINTSDVPGGVINILTGKLSELIGHFTTHMDVNSIVYCGDDRAMIKKIKSDSTSNLKRPVFRTAINWLSAEAETPYFISDMQETKTTWHPIGI
ncbi:MAG TPA: aldehyde dehydrogenase family protein [Flavobacteriales bacterium]|nr:aldehyde dehydrogenase family protein [Flavobacteriales bacterium]HIA12549.1 aldehyde dehydrogenase family protein [Flavobacteriales bacterium]HIO73444.1 aldehyde dehydrogenase family protein [Flavobacteriales bacterium]